MRVDLQAWNDFIGDHPNSHILQSGAWGDLKSSFGWKAVRILAGHSGAQILFRQLAGGFSIAYMPKGPVGSIEELSKEIDQVCKDEKAIFLKVEPDAWESEENALLMKGPGWIKTRPIQPQRTVILPLDRTEDELLAGMKQKTRYNIHLAEKKEIKVSFSKDVTAFYKMSEITGKRDGFGVHSAAYYQKALDLFQSEGHAEMILATYQDRPVAGLIVMAQGDRAWYMYGASSDEERNRMPTYLIQWKAMKWARARGCKYYDLWGIPDVDEHLLEENFTQKQSHDGLWGVYRFKRGFGGDVMRSVGAWDRIFSPWLYKAYQLFMRLRGRSEE